MHQENNEEVQGNDLIEEEKTLVLRKPVEFAKVTYESLDLCEPTAGQLSKANKAGDNIDVAIMLLSLVAKVPRGAIEKLGQRDLQEASDFLGSFTVTGHQTGGTSSPS